MSKYKKNIVTDIRKEKIEELKQEELKEKYDVQDDNVLVVEKNNVYKFTISLILSAGRMIIRILLFLLAVIGVLALIYPGPRNAMYVIILQICEQLRLLL